MLSPSICSIRSKLDGDDQAIKQDGHSTKPRLEKTGKLWEVALSSETYFLRSTQSVDPNASLEDRFASAVANTGNYFFEEALADHLEEARTVYSFEDLPEAYGTLVLSMSNFLSPATDLGWFAEQIEAKSVEKIVMVGAGAQAYEYTDHVPLTDGTLRFIHLLAEKGTTIGVRGYFTAEVLAGYGIKNVDVIGCPTAYWSGRKPIRPAPAKLERLAVHCTPEGFFRDKVGALFKHAITHDASYVIQSEKWMIPLINEAFASGKAEQNSEGRVSYYSYGFASPEDVVRWLQRKALVFFGMTEWISAMEGFDFVYGARFHGNMAAIQAGTPALNMPFDTRTRELCEYLNLPHLPFERFNGLLTPEQLFDMTDFSAFEKTYSSRMTTYKNFLESNGLKTKNLASSPTNGSQQRQKSISSFVALLTRDFISGDISKSDFMREIELRVRGDRTHEERKAVENGAILPVEPTS
ncbi:polysaccharide pyruvyl transferase family protein [Shinella sp. G-2]|uniref:polysaccharide pyruvyl transferase family protein n=1 Tax=Shinella sp. G-2 TaxID=3133141 RepID=UPI003D010FAA